MSAPAAHPCHPRQGARPESPEASEVVKETTEAEPPAAEAVTEAVDEMGEVSPGLMRELRRGFPEGLSFATILMEPPRRV